MRNFGLIGYPLGHSFSKKYFSEKFVKERIMDCRYENYPIEAIEEFPSLISSIDNLVGLNVTIPYKEKVIPYLDQLDDSAKEIGAVNTIKFQIDEGKLKAKGYNTDAYGFMKTIEDYLKPIHKMALILGTGGAAKAVEWSLQKLGLEVRYVSRRPKDESILSYEALDADTMKDYKVIVNSTPLGMHPKVEAYPPIPYEVLDSSYILYDLVYNPLETRFLQLGKEKKASVINGLPMLHNQAEKAWSIWMS